MTHFLTRCHTERNEHQQRGTQGLDAGKKVFGIKRHIAVDTTLSPCKRQPRICVQPYRCRNEYAMIDSTILCAH